MTKVLSASDFKSNSTDLKDSSICGLVLFYSPNCPHCVMLHPTYKEIAKKAIFANVCEIDCLQNRDFITALISKNPGFIQGYPTIYKYSGGKARGQYTGARDFKSIMKELMDLKCSI